MANSTLLPMKVVIDTDPGIDDCHAIMMALSCPYVQVLGLSCVTGNTSLENGIRNVHYLLHTLNRRDVPVFRGAERAIDGRQKYAPHIHGADGFGNATVDKQINLDLLCDEPAAVALVRLARENRGELVVIAIGPLTNLFLAHRIDPKFSRNIKRLFIMGGNCTIPRSEILSIGIEFNFASDPFAASIVLEEFQNIPIIVPYELTCMASMSFEFLETELVSLKDRDSKNRKAHFFYDISQFLIEVCKEEDNIELGTGFISCDAVCMACALDESVIVEKRLVYACVEPYGKVSGGHMIADWYRHFKREPNVEIVTDVDMPKFKKLFQLCV